MAGPYTPGDILLVNDYSGSRDLLGNLIRAGERARYGDTDDARWTHSALIVSTDGDIVEALARGVARSHISKYDSVEVLTVSPGVAADDPRRGFAVAFALSHVGDAYGYLDFVSLAMTLLTGLDWSLHSDRSFICSQLVARATECFTHDGYDWPCEQMMPADLAAAWGALSGEPVPSLSLFGRVLDKFRAVVRAISPF